MKENILIGSLLILCLSYSFYNLNSIQNSLNQYNLKSSTLQNLENSDKQQLKKIDVAVEKKLDLSELKVTLKEELVKKMYNLNKLLEEYSDELLKKQIDSLPKNVLPQVEKFTKERTFDDKKEHYKILTYDQETQMNLESHVSKWEKIAPKQNVINNIHKDTHRWFERYLSENTIEQRIKELQKIDLSEDLKLTRENLKKRIENKKKLAKAANKTAEDEKLFKETSDKIEVIQQKLEKIKENLMFK